MALTIEQIINNSNNYEEALRAFNSTPGLDVNTFFTKARNKWKIGSGNTSTTTSPSSSSSSGGFNTGDGTKTGTIDKIFDGLDKVFKGGAGIGSQIYQAQLGQQDNSQNLDAIQKLFDIVKSGGLTKLVPEALGEIMDQVLEQVKQEAQLRDQINSKTTLTGELSQGIRDDIEMSSVYAAKFGMSMSDVGDLYVGLVENSGKFSLINRQTMDNAAPVVKAFGTTMRALGDTISEFEKVGIGADKTISTINDAGIRSMSLGLSGRKVVSDIQMSIGKLNEYGFKNGVQGLESMVRKANEFRMSMDGVFTIADKVMNPEGAVELAANLQVLGGAIGDFNDPLKMMYMATNNVEGLQDALIGAAGSLATYNSEQGRFEITGINLRRAKEMAQQMGISYGELSKGAIAAAERSSAASSLMLRGLKVDDKDKEFLTNLSRMEGGEMKIMVPESIAQKLGVQTEIALDQLDQKTADALLQNKKDFEKMDSSEVAMQQLTETQRMSRDMAVVAAYYRVRAAQLAGGTIAGLGVGSMMESLQKTISEQRDIALKGRSDTGFQKRTETNVREFMEPIKNFVFGNDKTKIINPTTPAQPAPQSTPQKIDFGNPVIQSQVAVTVSGPINATVEHKNSYLKQ